MNPLAITAGRRIAELEQEILNTVEITMGFTNRQRRERVPDLRLLVAQRRVLLGRTLEPVVEGVSHD